MRQMKLTDDDLNVHAEVVFVAKNFDYAATRVLSRRRPIGNLNIHHQAFEIVPFPAARLFPEDSVCIRSPPAMHRRLLRRGSSGPAMGPALDSASFWLAGHSIPRGMMISLVTFSSMGVT